MHGEDDLYATILQLHNNGEPTRVARSELGRYANSLGPVALAQGKYELIIHPDIESEDSPEDRVEIFKFALDVLLEKHDIGEAPGSEAVVQQVMLCNLPTLPSDFNGPGMINRLSGNTISLGGKYRLAELLEGAHIKFDLPESSLVTFYVEVPEGLELNAQLTKVKGTHTTTVHSKDLNAHDESFLRQ
jgi:hypothetical protein